MGDLQKKIHPWKAIQHCPRKPIMTQSPAMTGKAGLELHFNYLTEHSCLRKGFLLTTCCRVMHGLTMRTNQERLSVRLMAAVMASPARPALTGNSTETMRAVPNTTMLLMKSILMPSHLFITCKAAHGSAHKDLECNYSVRFQCPNMCLL